MAALTRRSHGLFCAGRILRFARAFAYRNGTHSLSIRSSFYTEEDEGSRSNSTQYAPFGIRRLSSDSQSPPMVVAPLEGRAVLQLRGRDVLTFLQGMVTQDLLGDKQQQKQPTDF